MKRLLVLLLALCLLPISAYGNAASDLVRYTLAFNAAAEYFGVEGTEDVFSYDYQKVGKIHCYDLEDGISLNFFEADGEIGTVYLYCEQNKFTWDFFPYCICLVQTMDKMPSASLQSIIFLWINQARKDRKLSESLPLGEKLELEISAGKAAIEFAVQPIAQE